MAQVQPFYRGLVLSVVLGAVVSALLISGPAPAQDKKPAEAKPTGPEDIRQTNPGFLVRADVDKGTRSYREGDTLYVRVASEEDAYVYVLYKQADGKVFLIFPNAHQPDNRVKARQAVQIPASEDLFRWVVGPPFGKEIIKVIASKEPLRELSDPALREKFFNPISRQQVKGVELELGPQAPPWAEDYVEIVTYARNEKAPESGRRYAVFFGVGDYEFNDEFREAAEGKAELNLPPCHRDARRLAAVLTEVGRLSDVRLYTNDQVTRRQMEEALTQWLPSVSRPGDTVLIFFSGLAASPGDEPAGRRTAILAPHDFLPLPVLGRLLEKAKKEGIPTRVVPRVKAAVELYQRSGEGKAGAIALARATGVGQDLFAHWLQGLSGRRVVVILDAGHAGVFSPAGPSTANAAEATMEALGNQVGRLQGLGQQEIAFLGACGPQQSNVLRVPDELSLLSHCLVKLLAQAPGPVSLEQAHKVAAASMEELFAEVNRQRQAEGKEPVPPYKPHFVNTCSGPVMLKP